MTGELLAPESPYKGLRPFEDTSVDALLFFGRDRERELIAANLMAARFTVLYGASGVGKSSVLQAGVVHHLRELGRERAEFAVALFAGWSEDPVLGISSAVEEALADVLGVPVPDAEGPLGDRVAAWSQLFGGEIYLVLDQFDEYFLYHGQDGGGPLVEQLPSLVTEPGLRVNVLLGIREEALARLDVFKARIPGLFGNYLRLERLDPDAARAAIVGPLERWAGLAGGEHVEIEAGLVEAVLESVTTPDLGGNGTRPLTATPAIEPPYLQMVMERVWEAERSAGSQTLRQATLEELGGARTIVAEHLDRSLASLDPAQRDTAATMFAHLVTPSGTKIAHDLGDLASYAGAEETDVRGVAATLVGERILRPVGARGDGGRVEIFHDVLTGAVSDWQRRHEAERELEAERRRARRRHRRLLAVAIASLVALCAMAAVTAYALVQQREADDQRAEARDQRAEARAQARDARAGELVARAALQLDIDPQESLRLALDAARLSPGPETERGLRDALMAARLRGVLPVRTRVVAATFNGAGNRIVALGQDGDLRIFDARRRVLIRTVRGTPVTAGAFTAAGSVLVGISRGGTLLVWRAGGDAIRRALRPGGPIRTVSLSYDGGRVAVVGGRQVRIFDVASGRLLRRLPHPSTVSSASFSKAGDRIVTTSSDRTARIWDARTGLFKRDLLKHSAQLADAAVSPRGERAATVTTDGTGRVFSTASGALLANLVGHTNRVADVAFSPDGSFVVTASRDRTARVWRAETGSEQALLAGHQASVTLAAFSPNGRSVLTADQNGTVRIWDPEVQPQLRVLLRSAGPLVRVAVGSRGQVLAVAGAEGARLVRPRDGRTVRRLDARPVTEVGLDGSGRFAATAWGRGVTVRRVSTGEVLTRLKSPTAIRAVALSADGSTLATAHASGTARIWTIRGRPVRVLRGHEGAVTDVAFSPDGRRLVTTSTDETARVWNVESGKTEHTLSGHRKAVLSAAFRPDGGAVVTTSLDHDARTWAVRSGEPLQVLGGHLDRVSDAAYSPDGRLIGTAGPTAAGVWEARSGRRLLYLRGHAKRLTSVAFAPDSRRIFTTSLDRTVRTYVCEVCAPLDGLVALGKRRLAAAKP